MSNKQNGDKPHGPEITGTPLEVVEQQIAERRAEEEQAGLHSSLDVEEVPLAPEDDPLHRWKHRASGETITLEKIHEGLLAVAQFSEAAIEGGIRMAADIHKALPFVELNAHQLRVVAAKLESTDRHINQVDDELAKMGKAFNGIRKDVQAIRDDMREMSQAARQLPVIKDMLAEILARLPEPIVETALTRKR